MLESLVWMCGVRFCSIRVFNEFSVDRGLNEGRIHVIKAYRFIFIEIS